MPRIAVVIETEGGAQVCGITGEEASRLARDGVYRFEFGAYTLKITVDPLSEWQEGARVGALPWPDGHGPTLDIEPTPE